MFSSWENWVLTSFSRATINVLGKVQFLKWHFTCRISIANSSTIKFVPPTLTVPRCFLLRHTKILVNLIFFQHLFFCQCFLFVLNRKWCEAPLRLCVKLHLSNKNNNSSSYIAHNFWHKGEAVLRKHLREHDQKAALISEIRKIRNKPRISKNSAACRIWICDLANLSLTN